MADQAILLAKETSDHNPRPWLLLPHERGKHVLVLGADSAYKQSLLWNMMVQDIAAGAGVCVIDTTGEYGRGLLDAIPASRANQTLYFHLGNKDHTVAFNPFFGVPPEDRSRAAQNMVALFVAIWSLTDDSHPLMLRLIRASARALLDSQEGTLLGMYALLTNETYRKKIVSQCHDPMARRFWADFETWSQDDKRDKPQPVLTRLEAFLSDPHLRCVLGQAKSTLDLDRVVNDRQILIADIPRNELGAETAKLFGSLLATRIQTILESRTGGWPFYVYLPDAEQVHVSLAARALSGRYKNAGVVASVGQLVGHKPEHQNALLNAGRVVAFRLGPDDARKLAGRFNMAQPETTLTTLLPDHLAISGVKYVQAAQPALPGNCGGREHILRRSHNILGVPRQQVEDKITQFLDGLTDD